MTATPPEQAAYETWQETRWPGRVPVPWNHPATAKSREAWRAAVLAATGQEPGEARAERDGLRALVAEIREVLLQGGQDAGDARRQALSVIERAGFATRPGETSTVTPDGRL